MDLKHLITHFTYRIEPKPGGGFVAHATDPTVAPLEAATREELQRMIQATIAEKLASEFPGLKLPTGNNQLQFSFHIEREPGGGFTIHSGDPSAQPIAGVAHHEIESHFLEKLVNLLGKPLMLELSRALTAQGVPGNVKIDAGGIKISVNRTARPESGRDIQEHDGTRLGLASPGSVHDDHAHVESAEAADGRATSEKLDALGDTVSSSPIVPESGGTWAFVRFLIAAVLAAIVVYLLAHYR